VTARGQWYYASWKGDEKKSGGIATNIGVHFFDLLGHLFGKLERNVVHHRAMDCAAGYLEFERAKVRWFLSVNARDLPTSNADRSACRQITIGNRLCNLSGDFRELHARSYREILDGNGFPIAETRQAIAIVAAIRHMAIDRGAGDIHPYLEKVLADKQRYQDGYPV
jgi:UDP-N-acetyl-2-amino-2-deoxyglucuronate dehydrogenase